MIKHQLLEFVLRWSLSTFGMWISITLFGIIIGDYTPWLFVIAGLIFSLVNSVVKPLLTVVSLPLIVFTMGLFTLVINTAMVALAIWITPQVTMDFWGAVLSSLVMSLANGLVNLWLPAYNSR